MKAAAPTRARAKTVVKRERRESTVDRLGNALIVRTRRGRGRRERRTKAGNGARPSTTKKDCGRYVPLVLFVYRKNSLHFTQGRRVVVDCSDDDYLGSCCDCESCE